MYITRHYYLIPQNAREMARRVGASVEDMAMLAKDAQENSYVVKILSTEDAG